MLAAPQIIRGHSTVRPLLIPEVTAWLPPPWGGRAGGSLSSLSASTLKLCSWHLSKAFGKTRSTGKQQRAERSRLVLLPIIQHPTGAFIPCTTSRSCLWFPIRCSLPSEYPISLQPVNFKPPGKLLFSHLMNGQNFQSVMESMPTKTHSDSLIHEREILVSFFCLSKLQSRAGSVEWGYWGKSGIQGTNKCWVWKWRQWRQALCSHLERRVLWHPSNGA